MSSVSAQPFAGLFRAQSATSTFAFAVRHSGVFWFRGTLPDVEATLSDEGDGLVLDGVARAESISIAEPAAMRASVLGAAFFDVEHHPELRFRSTDIRLGEYDRRRPLTPTGTNLLGLVKHVASVEAGYLGDVFGRPSPESLPWFDDGAEPSGLVITTPVCVVTTCSARTAVAASPPSSPTNTFVPSSA